MSLMERITSWSRRNPVLDGMFLGFFTLLLIVVLRLTDVAPLSLGVSVVIVTFATGAGALLGLRRRRMIRRGAA